MTVENWLDFVIVILIGLNIAAYAVQKISGRDLEAMDNLMLATFLAVTLSL
jgi:hypothetical protein